MVSFPQIPHHPYMPRSFQTQNITLLLLLWPLMCLHGHLSSYGIRERKGTWWEHVKLTRQQRDEHILSCIHLSVIQCLLKTSHTTYLYIEIIRKQWK
jgi:hypothetical protein